MSVSFRPGWKRASLLWQHSKLRSQCGWLPIFPVFFGQGCMIPMDLMRPLAVEIPQEQRCGMEEGEINGCILGGGVLFCHQGNCSERSQRAGVGESFSGPWKQFLASALHSFEPGEPYSDSCPTRDTKVEGRGAKHSPLILPGALACLGQSWDRGRSCNLEWKILTIVLKWIYQFLNSDSFYNLKMTKVISLSK